jgi:hypothetical protein
MSLQELAYTRATSEQRMMIPEIARFAIERLLVRRIVRVWRRGKAYKLFLIKQRLREGLPVTKGAFVFVLIHTLFPVKKSVLKITKYLHNYFHMHRPDDLRLRKMLTITCTISSLSYLECHQMQNTCV